LLNAQDSDSARLHVSDQLLIALDIVVAADHGLSSAEQSGLQNKVIIRVSANLQVACGYHRNASLRQEAQKLGDFIFA